MFSGVGGWECIRFGPTCLPEGWEAKGRRFVPKKFVPRKFLRLPVLVLLDLFENALQILKIIT